MVLYIHRHCLHSTYFVAAFLKKQSSIISGQLSLWTSSCVLIYGKVNKHADWESILLLQEEHLITRHLIQSDKLHELQEWMNSITKKPHFVRKKNEVIHNLKPVFPFPSKNHIIAIIKEFPFLY